jgi:hypothetical protein
MSDERRRSTRVHLEKPAAASVRTYILGQVLNVSSGGIFLRVRKRLLVGAVYTMRLSFPEGAVELLGTVRRSTLAGFETDEDADRVRVYDSALEFEGPLPELMARFRPGQALQVRLEQDKTQA